MSTPLAIELVDVTVEVPGKRILERINWAVPRGQTAIVLGPNGCGKSTLLRVITAYGHFTSGRVRVLSEELGKTEVHALRRRLGVMDPALTRLLDPGVTAEELVATGLYGHLTTHFDRPTSAQLRQARALLEEVGLSAHARQPVETLSSGQWCRVWLARALVAAPEILILDEPTSALDLLGRETLLASLTALAQRRPELTTLIVTHRLEEVLPHTDQILLLAEGKIVGQGRPPEVLTPHNLSSTFGCPVEVICEQGRWRWSVSPKIWADLL